MNYPGFCGGSYTSSSPAIDAERSINVYPEVVQAAGVSPKSKINLRRRPGYNLLQTLPDTPGRGAFAINGRCFVVAGGGFYELTANGTTYVLRGSLAARGTSAVQMQCNTVQVGILADGLVYMFNLLTGAFAQVFSGVPANVASICTLDTYFLFLGAGSNQFTISAPLDGTSVSAIDFGSSQEPDNAVAIAQAHQYLWIFGQNETVLFQDSGNASFPFTRVPGSQIEQGCASAASVATLDNTLFWLGSDPRGPAVVYRADGLLPTRISTHAVEAAMQGYATVADAVAMTYQADGHLFYGLHFPTAGASWFFDVSAGMWHERAFWDTTTGTWSADIGRYHAFAFGKHVVCDYANGNVYEMTAAAATDNGAPLRWLRSAPHVADSSMWVFYSSLELDMETGGGLPDGSDPQIMVRWSDDGGFTWSDYRQVSCGLTGEYRRRVITRRLGRSRNRVFEVSGSDAIPRLAITGAYLNASSGVN